MKYDFESNFAVYYECVADLPMYKAAYEFVLRFTDEDFAQELVDFTQNGGDFWKAPEYRSMLWDIAAFISNKVIQEHTVFKQGAEGQGKNKSLAEQIVFSVRHSCHYDGYKSQLKQLKTALEDGNAPAAETLLKQTIIKFGLFTIKVDCHAYEAEELFPVEINENNAADYNIVEFNLINEDHTTEFKQAVRASLD